MFAGKLAKGPDKAPALVARGTGRAPLAASAAPGTPPARAGWSFATTPLHAGGAAIPVQRKLMVGSATDPLEQEADRVAGQVVRMAAPGVAVTGAPAGISRSCAACGDCGTCDDEEEPLRMKPSAAANASGQEAPGLVRDVLRQPGTALDPASRAFFAPRFGHDLGGVRVHTGRDAARSARGIGARAYASGPHIVFGAGQYAPHTADGRLLLAHELAHVMQQTGPAGHRPAQPVVSRYAEAEPEAEEDEEVETEAEGNRPGAHHPSPNSLQGRIQAHRKQDSAEQAQWELEQPRSTAERGGKPSEQFLEQKPKATQDVQTEYATERITYTPTVFHMLDAMEDDIARAGSEGDLLDIYRAYFPDSAASLAPPSIQGAGGSFRAWPRRVGLLQVGPAGADSDGSQRLPVFVAAAQRRAAANPKVTTDTILREIISGWTAHEAAIEAKAAARAQKKTGTCSTRDVPRKGGNKAHDAYAQKVTGSTTDFEVTTPAGSRCTFDGVAAMNPNVVWEVKTRHEWASPAQIPGAIFAPAIQDRILKMEEQMARCLAVARRCGFEYRWAFESKDAADFMATLWAGKVKVQHIP